MTFLDIALTLTPRLNPAGIVHLIEVFESAEKIYRATREELIHFAELRPEIADSIVARVGFREAKREVEYCERNYITAVAATDDNYPPYLYHAQDRPHVIYVVGNVEAISGERNLSIVGTRRISSYGERCCHQIVGDLSSKVDGLVIVSGLAFGVDGAAHRAALDYGVTTVAVIASPLPSVTPAAHTSLAADIVRNGGAIISECHSQTHYRSSLYISRNRIIAGLSQSIVVAESPLTGGSMVTAKIANDYSRAVFAVPGRVGDKNSEGCNMLIRNNVANIYVETDQIIRESMWDSQAPSDAPVVRTLFDEVADSLTPVQQQLMGYFKDSDILSVEELGVHSGLTASELSVALFELEMQGLVRNLPGNRCEKLSVKVAR